MGEKCHHTCRPDTFERYDAKNDTTATVDAVACGKLWVLQELVRLGWFWDPQECYLAAFAIEKPESFPIDHHYHKCQGSHQFVLLLEMMNEMDIAAGTRMGR